MRLGYHTITWGGVVGHPSGVTSVKDLYYQANGSMPQAIADVAAAGYEGTEMFDGNLLPYAEHPAELLGLLDAAGIELVSVYTGANFIYDEILSDELVKITKAAELAVAFGAQRLVVGGGARRATGTDPDDYFRLGRALDRVCDIAEEAGLDASYHPHLGTISDTAFELGQILPMTRIGFCPDTAHLAAGGGDPAELIRKYPDRLRHVHLKDVTVDPVIFLPLGEGVLDFAGILRAVMETGYDSWLMVELDSYDGDPKEAAVQSKQYLDKLLGHAGEGRVQT